MPIVEYPFLFPSKKSTWCPHLPIEIINTKNGCGKPGYAKVDTGAKYCFIPFNIAGEMDVSLDEKNETEVICAGVPRKGYRCDDIKINIFNVIDVSPDDVFVGDNIIIPMENRQVIFVHELKNPVLGVKGFLNNYVLTINYQVKKFSIRTPHEDRPCPICKPPS